MSPCRSCKNEVDDQATLCPKCGAVYPCENQAEHLVSAVIMTIVLAVLFILFGKIAGPILF